MSSTKEKNAKVRVFALAKELDLDTKTVLEFCKDLGYGSITNQLHGLDGDQVDAIKERIKKGSAKPAPAAAPAAPPVVAKPAAPPKIDARIQTIPKAKPKPVAEIPTAAEPTPVTPVAEVPPPVTPEPSPVVVPPVAEVAPPAVEIVAEPAPAPPAEVEAPAVVAEIPAAVEPPAAPVVPPPPAPARVPDLTRRPPIDLTRKPLNLKPGGPIGTPTQRPVGPPVVPQARPATPAPPAAGPQQPPTQNPPPQQGTPPRPGMNPPNVPPARVPQFGPPQRAGGTPRPTGQSGPFPPRPAGTGPMPGGNPPPAGTNPPGGPPRPGGMKPPLVPPPRAPGAGVKLTPEMMDRLRKMSEAGKRADLTQVQKTGTVGPPDRPPGAPGSTPPPGGPNTGPRTPNFRPSPAPGSEEEDEEKKKGPGAVAGRNARQTGRTLGGGGGGRPAVGRGPSTDRGSVIIGKDGQVEVIDTQSGSRRGPRAALLRKMMRGKQQVVKKEGPVEVAVPLTVRSLSEAIGMKAGELILKLKQETQKLFAINSNVEFDVAELIAIGKGITLVAKKQATAEDNLLDGYKKRAEEVEDEKLRPRAPVVTIMGHVDHGKTSLLDKIRKSNVVDTEAGGITQVIRAWSVMYNEKPITFLDTPGHEAFTKMRARGANVTDIVVIVVAATDGVMPQTEEAISHAQAAGVDIIVAINKIDMPNANVDKTRRQLYSLNLLPDNMGGEVPFVETSAATGEGIDELLESILIVAELADLKADPEHPASGTCLEAYLEGQEGVMATLLVQQGTLRKGDVVLCGSSFGRVRAMYDDLGRPISEAGPSTPVKITGLDDVPDADDPFYAVEAIGTAREIAETRKGRMQRAGQTAFAPVSLESLTMQRSKIKITELKVILKAEARGSVEAIKKELEKLVHEEVRTRVLHAGIGAITESDVILALTSPDDTIVVGFNVTADDAALRLAEARGVKLNEYDIIYKLTDDIKSSLEGKLKPIEEVVHLGRAIIRQTFRITKVGTIAGCYVTSGTIERSARVRIIRQGVVVYPPSEKVVGLDNLKRFKDDVKEVREGFECGLKITGFDDVKVDDVVEAFKIEIKQRTL